MKNKIEVQKHLTVGYLWERILKVWNIFKGANIKGIYFIDHETFSDKLNFNTIIKSSRCKLLNDWNWKYLTDIKVVRPSKYSYWLFIVPANKTFTTSQPTATRFSTVLCRRAKIMDNCGSNLPPTKLPKSKAFVKVWIEMEIHSFFSSLSGWKLDQFSLLVSFFSWANEVLNFFNIEVNTFSRVKSRENKDRFG